MSKVQTEVAQEEGLKVIQKATLKEVLINASEFGDNPVWRDVFAEAEKAHPGYTTRFSNELGTVDEGGNSAIAFKGKFHAQEVKVAIVQAPRSLAARLSSTWVALHPRAEGQTSAKYAQVRRKAITGELRAMAIEVDLELEFGYQVRFIYA